MGLAWAGRDCCGRDMYILNVHLCVIDACCEGTLRILVNIIAISTR
jgi:hypothetical protein